MRLTLRRVRLIGLGGLLAVVVFVGLAGLNVWAVAGIRRAEKARHHDVAERLFDAMEVGLSEMVEREERRSFLEYRSYYVPVGGQDVDDSVRSPLAEVPEDSAVVGYFQVEPDGKISNPGELDAEALERATAQNWMPPESQQQRVDVVKATVEDVGGWVFDNRAPSLPPKGVERLNSFGVQRRMDREELQIQTGSNNVAAYQQRPAAQLPTDAVDVRVTPMVGQRVGRRLVLHRTVHVGGEVYRQGLVIDPQALADRLELEVLDAAGLQGSVDFAWDSAAEPQGRWTFPHTFGAPFQDLSVRAGLVRLPGVRGFEEPALFVVVAILAAAVLAVGAALGWAVWVEITFAQRRSDFVAAVTHELKTPLTAIRMYAEMLRDGMVPDPERQHAYHQTITSESERLSRLIGNVLELARMEQGLARAEAVVGEVGPVLEEVAAMLRPHAAQQGVSIVVTVARDLPPASIDRDALIQVLTNLVDNAVKFGGAGEVRLEAVAASQGVMVRVADQGPGVPQAQLPLIFDAFYRGERELTRKTQGTGIGLALGAGRVRDMGGRVWAANAPEGGLVVSVVLAAPGRPAAG